MIAFEDSPLRLATITLSPGDKYACEPGAIVMLDDLVTMTSYFGGLSDNKVMNAVKAPWYLLKRKVSGEKATMVVVESQAIGDGAKKNVVIGPPSLGTLETINCQRSGGLVCKRGAFISAKMPVDVSFKVIAKAGIGFFGPGFVFQQIVSEADVILWAPAPIMRIRLADNSIRVDPKSMLAYTPSIKCNAEFTGVKNAMFGGEGLVMLKLEGTGYAWITGGAQEQQLARQPEAPKKK